MISICNYLQEAASNHARALGVSVEQLEESNTTWVLARLRVEMDRYPRWRNEVRVETWPSGTERLFATRDFLVSDEGGLILGRATSAWLLIDRRRRRPVRLPADIVGLNLPDRPRVFDDGDVAIPVVESGESEAGVDVRKIRARYGDMDVNGHVNNVCYIEWAMEPVRKDVLESGQVARMDVQFKGEAVFGDAVEIAVEVLGGTDLDRPDSDARDSLIRGSMGPDSLVLIHTVRRTDDTRELTRLRSVWRNVS